MFRESGCAYETHSLRQVLLIRIKEIRDVQNSQLLTRFLAPSRSNTRVWVKNGWNPNSALLPNDIAYRSIQQCGKSGPSSNVSIQRGAMVRTRRCSMGIIIIALRFEGGSWKDWEVCSARKNKQAGRRFPSDVRHRQPYPN